MNCPSGAAAEHPAAVPASAGLGVSKVLPPAPPAAGQAAAAGGSATGDTELQDTELQALKAKHEQALEQVQLLFARSRALKQARDNEKVDCAAWGCSCQNFSDLYSVGHGLLHPWGLWSRQNPEHARHRRWYMNQSCCTLPRCNAMTSTSFLSGCPRSSPCTRV